MTGTRRAAAPWCAGSTPRLAPGSFVFVFFFQAEDGIRDVAVTGVQTWLFRSHGHGFLLSPLFFLIVIMAGRLPIMIITTTAATGQKFGLFHSSLLVCLSVVSSLMYFIVLLAIEFGFRFSIQPWASVKATG